MPLIGVFVAPLVTCACMIGMIVLPQFTAKSYEIRHWFLDRGFSSDFVCGHLTFFASQVPTILTLSLFAVFFFAIRVRICDQVVVVTLASLPFVEALQVSSMSDASHVPNIGWLFLKTQALTGLTLFAIICMYLLARRQWPNPAPTRTRTLFASLLLSAIFIPSIIFYQYAT
jgi:hypothetical protein